MCARVCVCPRTMMYRFVNLLDPSSGEEGREESDEISQEAKVE